MKSSLKSLNRQIALVDTRLERIYGIPRRLSRDAVGQLIGTILSQATTDKQTARSYDNLRRRFPTWEQVRDARVTAIAKEIRSSGLSQHKAPVIKAALQHITRERGKLDLKFLKKMPVDEARRWLMNISGVGPKTASIVLLFTFGLPAFPVDTHIFRVTKRLGWVPEKTTYEKAHQILGELIPPERYYPLHINLIRFGREICVAGVPRCEICPLTDVCKSYQRGESICPSTAPGDCPLTG
ncbi:MAG: endonuclease III [Anaerolineae bacterium]